MKTARPMTAQQAGMYSAYALDVRHWNDLARVRWYQQLIAGRWISDYRNENEIALWQKLQFARRLQRRARAEDAYRAYARVLSRRRGLKVIQGGASNVCGTSTDESSRAKSLKAT